jgi:hypothetical protein
MRALAHEGDPRVWKAEVGRHSLRVVLDDGRKLAVPLAWFPRLSQATPRQRANFEIICDGEGIRWPDVDEDLSAIGLLRGTPAPGGVVTLHSSAHRQRKPASERSRQRRRAPRRPGR